MIYFSLSILFVLEFSLVISSFKKVQFLVCLFFIHFCEFSVIFHFKDVRFLALQNVFIYLFILGFAPLLCLDMLLPGYAKVTAKDAQEHFLIGGGL